MNYNTENRAMHGLLFVGYEDLRDSFMLMDSLQMWGANQDFDGKAETFIRLPLSRKVFTALLEDMAEAYVDENGDRYIPFYSIERTGETFVKGWQDIFSELIKLKPESRFCEIIRNFDKYREQSRENRDYPSRLRQQLNGTAEIIIDSVYRLLESKICTDDFKKHVKSVLEKYAESSDRLSLVLIKNLASPVKADTDKLLEKDAVVRECEEGFFKIIEDICVLPDKNDREVLINLISKALFIQTASPKRLL